MPKSKSQSSSRARTATGGRHSCNICERTFLRSSDVPRHVNAVHLKIKRFRCKICDKAFAQKTGLETHLNIHSGRTPYVCRVGCNHPAFSDPSSRSRHEYEAHAPPGFVCPEGCSKYRRKESLMSHIKRHHASKARTYTKQQLSNQITRKAFNDMYLLSGSGLTKIKIEDEDDLDLEAMSDDVSLHDYDSDEDAEGSDEELDDSESRFVPEEGTRRSSRLASKPLPSMREVEDDDYDEGCSSGGVSTAPAEPAVAPSSSSPAAIEPDADELVHHLANDLRTPSYEPPATEPTASSAPPPATPSRRPVAHLPAAPVDDFVPMSGSDDVEAAQPLDPAFVGRVDGFELDFNYLPMMNFTDCLQQTLFSPNYALSIDPTSSPASTYTGYPSPFTPYESPRRSDTPVHAGSRLFSPERSSLHWTWSDAHGRDVGLNAEPNLLSYYD